MMTKDMEKIRLFCRLFFIIFIFFINGCVTIPDKLVYGENEKERKEAFISLDKISESEARYTARDLKEIFVSSTDKYKIRAAYGLIRLAVVMAKNNNPKESLDCCYFVLTYGLIDSYGIKTDIFSRQMMPYFLSNLSFILAITTKERKTKTWGLLANFFAKYKDKYKIKPAEKQIFLIKEASALNLLDNAYKYGNVMFIYDIINKYKNTKTFKIATKIIHIITKEKDKNKRIEIKYILLNNNDIFNIYKKSVVEIDNFISKISISLIKK